MDNIVDDDGGVIEEFVDMADRISVELDARMDEGNYLGALEFSQDLIRTCSPGIPSMVEAFALFSYARVIWNSYDHYLGRYAKANSYSVRQDVVIHLKEWIQRLPEGYKAAKRAVELTESEYSDAVDILNYYNEEASKYNYVITGIISNDMLPKSQEDLYQDFCRLSDAAKEKEDMKDFIGAIQIYDQVLLWMEKVQQSGGQWEGATRFRIARCINNGIKYSGELAAGDWGSAGRLKEMNDHLMDKMTNLAPRGKREAQAAMRLLPNDHTCLKLLFYYEEAEKKAPWLFNKSSIGSSQSSDISAKSSTSPAVKISSNSTGCSSLLMPLMLILAVIVTIVFIV
ncbi:MAG: hypothetical protein ACYDCO_04060 [Armatimonadota bacterium]